MSMPARWRSRICRGFEVQALFAAQKVGENALDPQTLAHC
jgi:hypothetical protein